MQVHRAMRTLPARAIGLALALFAALVLAGMTGYALRGAVFLSRATVNAPHVSEGQRQSLPPELTGPTGPTDADADQSAAVAVPLTDQRESADQAARMVPTNGLVP